jgi:outer membrane receptor protein involved in Fe transport
MLTDEVVAAFGEMDMKLAHLTVTLAIICAATACTAERAISPQPATQSIASVVSGGMQIPLLYVVDGVRLERDQVPSLTRDQISAVEVIKGRAALKQYGPDASYGVVVITTKAAAAPHS